MSRSEGGIVKPCRPYKINGHCSHCLSFRDADYTIDLGMMCPNIEIPKINTDMTPEEIEEIKEEIRKQVKQRIKIDKFSI